MPETTDTFNNMEQPISAAAQTIILQLISQLRHSNDLSSILQEAIEALTTACGADRGLIWQIEGDQLAVTNESTVNGDTCFLGKTLGAQESTAIVLEFLSRFSDESGTGVLIIPDTAQDTKLHIMSSTLSALIELGEVRARLMVQLRSRGIFSGFLELQHTEPWSWSVLDTHVLKSVGDLLSVVVQQSFDQSKIEMDAKEMKLVNEIGCLFRESFGLRTQDALVKSSLLFSEHMGFSHAQIYLLQKDLLVPQIDDGKNESLELTQTNNPYVAVSESGRGKVVNLEPGSTDPFFGNDMALVLPLISQGQCLGVVGLWQRLPNKPGFRPQDRELALTISGHLSDAILADLKVRKLRSDLPENMK